MPIKVFLKSAAVLLFSAISACGDGSVSFNPLPPDEPPPDEPPPVAVIPAFTQLAFEQPLAMMQAPGEPSRWFVVEKAGVVWEFPDDADATLNEVIQFVDLTDRVDSSPREGGLLGMAFHPGFDSNGEVFVFYTRSVTELESVVSRFTVDQSSGALDESSEEVLLTVPQFAGNHNGGSIVFGPDGFLYIGFGDGGGNGDPEDNGQDTTNLLATVVRIDVDGGTPYAIPADNPFAGNTECPEGTGTLDCPEIFAWGFRNPWRFSFDRQTGNLWLGDVGQNSWEEVNRVEISENYGWSEREGAHCFDPPAGCSTDNVDPVTEYGHDVGDSITGGYVYRGSDIPDLQGFYLFGDFGSGRIWAVAGDSAQGVEPDEIVDTNLNIASFAESNDGELYVVDITAGAIHQIVAD
ncbi:MAG TPA: PQQ-dependent sugar dehydrogenase [Woeseiaceae bacterium]